MADWVPRSGVQAGLSVAASELRVEIARRSPRMCYQPLGLQMAQSRTYLYTLRHKMAGIYTLAVQMQGLYGVQLAVEP